MNILAVDDERSALSVLERAIRQVAGEAKIACFLSPDEALEYARGNKVDVAFLDINMPEINGLMLAKHLKDIYGNTNIIFVTGYEQYAQNAFKLRASGYLGKPVSPGQVLSELENLRTPVKTTSENRVTIQCFGNFTVFVDGDLLTISRPKAKELLAYLVHKRGAAVTSAEIASALWENKDYNKSLQSQTRNTIAQLTQTLRDAGIKDIIKKAWNSLAIDTQKISCDFYSALQGDVHALNTYTGEYMSQYSWAEFTVGYLDEKHSQNLQHKDKNLPDKG